MKNRRKTVSLSATQAKEILEGRCTCLRLPIKLKYDNTHFDGEPVWEKGNSPCSWNVPRSLPRELSRVSIVVESCEAVQASEDNGAGNGQGSWVWEVSFRILK